MRASTGSCLPKDYVRLPADRRVGDRRRRRLGDAPLRRREPALERRGAGRARDPAEDGSARPSRRVDRDRRSRCDQQARGARRRRRSPGDRLRRARHVRRRLRRAPRVRPRGRGARPCLLPCRARPLGGDGRHAQRRRRAASGSDDASHPSVVRRADVAEAARWEAGGRRRRLPPLPPGRADAPCRPRRHGGVHRARAAARPQCLARAVLEGVAYGLRDSLELLRELGVAPTRGRVSGGGARSRLWLEIVASVLGLPARAHRRRRGLGVRAALLAGVASGTFAERPGAVAACVRTARRSSRTPPGRGVRGRLRDAIGRSIRRCAARRALQSSGEGRPHRAAARGGVRRARSAHSRGAARCSSAAMSPGVCRTDLEMLHGGLTDPRWVRFPLVPGHEWSGTVAELGEGVDDLAVGDRVVCEGMIPCNRCRRCKEGETQLCLNYDQIGFTRGAATASTCRAPPRRAPVSRRRLLRRRRARRARVLRSAWARARPAPARRDDRRDRHRHARVARRDARAPLLARRARRATACATRSSSSRAVSARRDRPRRRRGSVAATQRLVGGGLDLVIETAGAVEAVELATRLVRPGGRVVLMGIAGEGRRSSSQPTGSCSATWT